MATNAGITSSQQLIDVDDSLSANIGTMDAPSVGEDFEMAHTFVSTSSTPIPFPLTHLHNPNNAAILTSSWAYNVYNRVWILPARYDFGNILTPQNANVEVWNAFYDDTVLLDIVFNALDGIIITNDDTPKVFEPLESTIYNFIVGLIGSPQLDGSIDFSFTLPDLSPQTQSVYVTASRVLIFPFSHDAQERIKEEFNWLTEVIEADNGTEQFIVKRLYPRRKVNFKPILTRSNSDASINARLVGLFKSLLEGWQNRVFAIASWQDVQLSSAILTAGQTVINIDTIGRDYEIASFAMLWKDEYTVEIAKIIDVSDTSLTLEAGLQNNWTLPAQFSLSDAFDDNVTDSAKWSLAAYVSYSALVLVAEINKQSLRITPVSNNASTLNGGYRTPTTFNFTSKYAQIKAVQRVNANALTREWFGISVSSTVYCFFVYFNGNLIMRYRNGGADNDVSITFSATDHLYWRIRNQGTNFHWETSADGLTWVIRRTVVSPITITAVSFDIGVGTTGSTASPGFALFDDFVTNVTLTSATEASSQVRIAPAKLARMNNPMSVLHTNYHLAAPNIDFDLEPQQPVSKRLKADTYTSFNSLRVLLRKTNTKDLSLNYDRKIVVADSRSGAKFIDALNAAPKVSNRYSIGVKDKLELAKVLEFMYVLKGQNGVFYVPNNLSDLIVAANIGSGDLTFTIANIKYTQQQFAAAKNRSLMFLMKDGTRYFRTITNAVETSSTIETLTINSNFGVAIATANIDKVSFVRKVRLDSDRFTLTHHAPTGLALFEFGIIDTF